MIIALTKENLLSAMKSMMAEHWWGPMESAADAGFPSGWEMIEAFAEQWHRISQSVEDLARQGHISYAEGGTVASVTLTFSRIANTALTIKAGTPAFTSWGLFFILQEAVVWAGGDATDKTVLAFAIRANDDYNVPEESVVELRVPNAADLGDVTITVKNVNAAAGGAKPMLDMLVANRLLVREPGEDNETLRVRYRSFPDNITPGAMLRAIEAVFGPLELEAEYIDGYDAGMFLDLCDPSLKGELYDAYCDAGVHADDPYKGKFQRMLLSREDSRRSFFVIVPEVGAIGEYGIFAGASTKGPMDPVNEALDVSANDVGGALDGRSLDRDAIYAAVWQALDARRAGGIRHAVIGKWTL